MEIDAPDMGDCHQEFYGDRVVTSNQLSGEHRVTKSLVKQQRKERAEAVSETHDSLKFIASTSETLYPRNLRSSAIEQQLGVNNDTDAHDLEELCRKVAFFQPLSPRGK